MGRLPPMKACGRPSSLLPSSGSLPSPSAIPPISARPAPLPWRRREQALSASPSAIPTVSSGCMGAHPGSMAPIRLPAPCRWLAPGRGFSTWPPAPFPITGCSSTRAWDDRCRRARPRMPTAMMSPTPALPTCWRRWVRPSASRVQHWPAWPKFSARSCRAPASRRSWRRWAGRILRHRAMSAPSSWPSSRMPLWARRSSATAWFAISMR